MNQNSSRQLNLWLKAAINETWMFMVFRCFDIFLRAFIMTISHSLEDFSLDHAYCSFPIRPPVLLNKLWMGIAKLQCWWSFWVWTSCSMSRELHIHETPWNILKVFYSSDISHSKSVWGYKLLSNFQSLFIKYCEVWRRWPLVQKYNTEEKIRHQRRNTSLFSIFPVTFANGTRTTEFTREDLPCDSRWKILNHGNHFVTITVETNMSNFTKCKNGTDSRSMGDYEFFGDD